MGKLQNQPNMGKIWKKRKNWADAYVSDDLVGYFSWKQKQE